MKNYADLDDQAWQAWLKKEGEKEFHARQILHWIYQKGVLSWSEMSNLSQELRAKLTEQIRLPVLEPISLNESAHRGVVNFEWRLQDGLQVESSLICEGKHRTVCVSSQVGAPLRSSLFASGQGKFKRNLRSAEIIEQVLRVHHWLAARGEKITDVVYGKTGEPLKNYEAVLQSLKWLIHPDFLHFSPQRITLTTVGIIEGIRRLALEGIRVNLALSLHAPNQEIREQVIPYARKFSLEQILAALDEYTQKTKRAIIYDYTLLAGINDHPDQALELAYMLKGKPCFVSLSRYTPISGLRFKSPSQKAVKHFRSVLYGLHIKNACCYFKEKDSAS